MRTTVEIPDELLRSAKKRASQRGQSLSRLVQQAICDHLEHKDTDEPFELVVCGTPGGKIPSPAQVYELLDTEDRGEA